MKSATPHHLAAQLERADTLVAGRHAMLEPQHLRDVHPFYLSRFDELAARAAEETER